MRSDSGCIWFFILCLIAGVIIYVALAPILSRPQDNEATVQQVPGYSRRTK